MQKYLFIIVMLILSLSKTVGQGKKIPNITYGLSMGVNSSNFNVSNAKYLEYGKEYSRGLGYSLAFRFRAELIPNFFIESGLSYVTKNVVMDDYEFIAKRNDYLFENNQLYSFEGTHYRKSDLNHRSIQIPIQLNIAILSRKNYSIEVFGGIFREFVLKLNNNIDIKSEIIPKLGTSTLDNLALTRFLEQSKSPLSSINSLFRHAESDVDGTGFQYGIAAHFKKFGIEIASFRPENTFGQSAIYQMNSVAVNFQYFIK